MANVNDNSLDESSNPRALPEQRPADVAPEDLANSQPSDDDDSHPDNSERPFAQQSAFALLGEEDC
ncbi:hypothetical protein GGH92_010300 [Coemansia sp. RSA 2673]|nr:hypothetical protein GGH92_010300 [Coemansia sp. RSA 2673]